MVPGDILRVHVSLASRRNPLLVESPLTSLQLVPPGVTHEADAIPPGSKDPPTVLTTERYWDILPLPLAGMFSGRVGRPEKLGGDKYPNAADAKERSQREQYSGSEASDK